MVDLGSDKVLVAGSNLLTELVPCRGGSIPISTHGHNPGPLDHSRPWQLRSICCRRGSADPRGAG
jgi:hypothetical protein